jgi:hypothetical protein
MIIIKISGGLGNQLFQFAFGKYVSYKLNTVVKYDIHTENGYSKFTQRTFGLKDIILDHEIANENDVTKFRYFRNKFLARIERKLIQKAPIINPKYIIQDLFMPISNSPKFKDNCYYDGYWQSEKYFKPIESIIRQEFNQSLKLDENNASLLHDIEYSESVSLHIRRGDYISNSINKKIYSECTLEYYKQAILFISSKIMNPTFYVFSDDLDWVKLNFKEKIFRIVDNSTKSPETDLFLMSRCKHHIIANSSFSWWGAWLNNQPKKIVIAPKTWYINKMSDADIIPDGWVKIDNNLENI